MVRGDRSRPANDGGVIVRPAPCSPPRATSTHQPPPPRSAPAGATAGARSTTVRRRWASAQDHHGQPQHHPAQRDRRVVDDPFAGEQGQSPCAAGAITSIRPCGARPRPRHDRRVEHERGAVLRPRSARNSVDQLRYRVNVTSAASRRRSGSRPSAGSTARPASTPRTAAPAGRRCAPATVAARREARRCDGDLDRHGDAQREGSASGHPPTGAPARRHRSGRVASTTGRCCSRAYSRDGCRGLPCASRR